MKSKYDIPRLPGVTNEVHFTRTRDSFFIIPSDTSLGLGSDELWSARRGWFLTDVSKLSAYSVSPLRGTCMMVRNLFVSAPRILWAVLTNKRSIVATPRILWAALTNKRSSETPDQPQQRREQTPSIEAETATNKMQALNEAFDRVAARADPEFASTIEKLRAKVEANLADREDPPAEDAPS